MKKFFDIITAYICTHLYLWCLFSLGTRKKHNKGKTMKTLYLDCTNGVSGDMVLHALAELAGIECAQLPALEIHSHDHDHTHSHGHDHHGYRHRRCGLYCTYRDYGGQYGS